MLSCFVRVWTAKTLVPSESRFELLDELALGRELLGVDDASVSRAQNAPKLIPRGASESRLVVPQQCANSVVVIESCNFDKLSRGLPPGERWHVGPAGLSASTALVFGRRSSVALLRSLKWDRPGPIDHLIPLPRAQRVLPGQEVTVQAPALLVVGEGAVALTPGETVLPNSEVRDAAVARSFRLPVVGITLAGVRELDGFLETAPPERIELAGWPAPCTAAELPTVAAQVLSDKHHYAFVPALIDEREPRLCLLYRRADGTARALLSDGGIEEWLRDIEEALRAAERPSIAPRSMRTAAELAVGLSLEGKVLDPIVTDARGEEFDDLTDPVGVRPQVLDEPAAFGPICTRNVAFAKLLDELRKVAEQDIDLLLLGESGSGKEYVAKAVHEASRRAAGPFVAFNCAVVTESLIESQLFGHKKGAFSGALVDRAGIFQSANGGTLLLDEIGDAPLHVQLALLRVLEERTVRPLGADGEQPVDVRVIAATSRDVSELIRTQQLREDLYYRLAAVPLRIPPLRERVEDLPIIAGSILNSLNCPKPLTEGALVRLCQHTWRGNVRQLGHALRRAVALSGDAPRLEADNFPELDPLGLEAPSETPPFTFPDLVRGIALHALKQESLPIMPDKSQYEQRALQRAALLCLGVSHAQLPRGLNVQWGRLFGSKWDTTEGGRGFRDLLRALGRPATDEAAAEWVRKKLG